MSHCSLAFSLGVPSRHLWRHPSEDPTHSLREHPLTLKTLHSVPLLLRLLQPLLALPSWQLSLLLLLLPPALMRAAPPFPLRASSPLEPWDFVLLPLHAGSGAPLEVAEAQPSLLWPAARSLGEHLTARPRSLGEHLLLQRAWPEVLFCLFPPALGPGALVPSSLFLFLALLPLFLFLFLFVEEGEVRELEVALRRPDTPRCKPARL